VIALPTRRLLLQGMALGAASIAMPGALLHAAAADKRFRGLFPIGATPVGTNDKVDFAQLGGQVTWLRRARVPGIAWPQIASGWTVLTEAERLQGAEALWSRRPRAGETAVVIGVQSPDLAAVKRYAAHAGEDRRGRDHLHPARDGDGRGGSARLLPAGRQAHANLPLFVQAVGKMSVDLLVRMYETIPTMRYVKDESGEPLERVQELLKRTKGEVADFSGRGANTLVTEMERGFIGACPFMSLPDVYQGAWEAWEAGDKAKAFQIFGAIQAANTMFSQSAVESDDRAGIVHAGHDAAGGARRRRARPRGAIMPARSVEEIRRVLDTYLRPYLRV
jgi:4-hydroxy-tetrahydrodipicolinate synthase